MNSQNLRKYIKPIPARNPDDVAVIMYTSGSSGVPKGVMLTNKNLDSNCNDSITHAHFEKKTVFLGVLPMFHTLGLQGSLLIPLKLGSKVVYQARFSPVGVFELVKKHGVKVLIMVPTMYSVMAAAKSGNKESLAGVEYAISGGEPLPTSLINAFKEKFGITLYEGFGLTETSPIVSLNTPWASKPGSVGTPIPEMQLRIVGDDGKDLPRNTDGELYIKGPNVMKGYYNRPDVTAEVLTPDGWFKTGDVAKIDDDGFIYITGRKKDMIIMAGEKVFPREIEDALKQHPAVVLAAVIGMKDESRGEAPVAFVTLKPEAELGAPRPTANELRNFVRERIAPYKVPREVHIFEDLPKNATGKIQKRELPALIQK
jgi:long-chain acyl-CoA synthetase